MMNTQDDFNYLYFFLKKHENENTQINNQLAIILKTQSRVSDWMFIAKYDEKKKIENKNQFETTICKKSIHSGGQTHINRIDWLKCLHELKNPIGFEQKAVQRGAEQCDSIARYRHMHVKVSLKTVLYFLIRPFACAHTYSLSECVLLSHALCMWCVDSRQLADTKYHKRLVWFGSVQFGRNVPSSCAMHRMAAALFQEISF